MSNYSVVRNSGTRKQPEYVNYDGIWKDDVPNKAPRVLCDEATFNIAPLKSDRGKRSTYVIGFDSEAERGKPFLFQFGHPDEHVDLLEVPNKKWAGIYTFFDYLDRFCATNSAKTTEYIVFGFNLNYEWTQLFRDLSFETRNADEFEVDLILPSTSRIKIRATNNKRYWLTAEFGKTKRRVKLVDAHAFVVGSLDTVGELLGLGRKLKKPKKFSRASLKDTKFLDYAKQDAILTQKVGSYIIGLHEQFNVRTTISAPHYASTVFRKVFLETNVPLAEPDVEQLGLLAYHGGKNGFYLDKPTLIKDVWYIDIRSAYPEAMAQLPDITKGRWRYSKNYVPNSHSIWKITARNNQCKYRCLQTLYGEWISGAGIVTTFSTGYEIDQALIQGDIDLIKAEGYVYDGPSGGPFVSYVDHFYAMKRNATTAGEKALAKLALNSLYGKTFQKVPIGNVGIINVLTGEMSTRDETQPYDFKAGGLYHPGFAALITGFVRAKIHGMEHKYGAIATSTDGIFAYSKPDENDVGQELGKLDCEVGKLRILRERDYSFRPNDGSKPKYAFHGFRGTKEQFDRIPLKADFTYKYRAEQMVTLRMSRVELKGVRYEPGMFVELPYEFVIPAAQLPP